MYTGPVSVSLSSSDDTYSVASTYYSIDGGSLALYRSPFTVSGDGSHTVFYYSTDQVGNQELTEAVSFQIDTQAPTTQAEVFGAVTPFGPGLVTSISNSVSVNLLASDPTPGSGVAGTYYAVDGGAFVQGTGPFTVSGYGWHFVYYYSVDNAGISRARKRLRS